MEIKRNSKLKQTSKPNPETSEATVKDLALNFLEQHVAVQALKGKLASEENELARRAKALCEKAAIAAAGMPILIHYPLGYVALTLDEDWDDAELEGAEKILFLAYEAVKVQDLQTPDQVAGFTKST